MSVFFLRSSIQGDVPGPATALDQLVASMSAGQWAELEADGLSAAVGVGGSTGNMIPYCNAGTWNRVSKRIQIMGHDHGAGNMRLVEYDEATNAFAFVENIGTTSGHGYDHYEADPVTGDLYYAEYGLGTGLQLWKKPFGGSWDSSFSTIPMSLQVARGTCWWTGSMTPSIGARGALLIGDPAFGQFGLYDPVADDWETFGDLNTDDDDFVSTYHSVMAYSAVNNCAVFGGGNDMPRYVWRVNSDRTITRLTDAPEGCQLGIYQGALVCDPASGKFLVLSGGLWELDPTGSGTWTQLTGSAPPSAVNDPAATENVCMFELPEHGVVGAVSMSGTSGNVHLYRRA
jgi:hypothetical protein